METKTDISIESKKFYEDLPDYKSFMGKMKRLQSGKKDDYTIDKANLFAQEVFEAMETRIRALETENSDLKNLVELANIGYRNMGLMAKENTIKRELFGELNE